MAATANVTELLLWALHVATDSYDRPGGMWFNPGYLGRLDERSWEPAEGEAEPGPPSRPELPRRFGEWPCAGLVSEIEAGNVRALLVVGGNPVTAFPDVERTRAALASLDVLAVVDVVPGETTELATHVLPAVDQLERADTTWLLDTYQLAVAAQWTDAVVAPLAERRPVWWMFGALGQRLGVDPLPRGVELASASDADVLAPLLARSVDGDALRASPTGVAASGAVFGWVREKVLPPGGWRLAPAGLIAQLEEHVEVLSGAPGGEVRTSGGGSRLVLVPHRQMATMNSQLRDITAPGARPASVAVLAHPSVVEALGGPGTPVSVRSPWGTLVAPLRVDDRLHPEAVAVAHGWDHPNVSALTSATEAIDPLTGMVLQSGVPVTLEPAT
jgi:anaerobic selenocysteine-containing dehydrogenase